MKIALLAIWLIASAAYSEELQLGFYSAFPEDGQPGDTRIFDLSEKADRGITQDWEKKFNLGLGKITEGILSPIRLTFDEIEHFLENEKHKDMIVVWFDKSIMWNEKPFIAERAKEVTKQMQKVGYKRVVILGAHGSGVHYVADTELNKKKSEGGDYDSKKQND